MYWLKSTAGIPMVSRRERKPPQSAGDDIDLGIRRGLLRWKMDRDKMEAPRRLQIGILETIGLSFVYWTHWRAV